MIQQPHEEFLIAALDRKLKPHTLDGSEGHVLLDALAAAIRDADGDPVRIHSATRDAKLRLCALLTDLVPRECVADAVCRILENWR